MTEYPKAFTKYLLWAKTRRFQNRLAFSQKVVLEAFKITDRWYVSCSGGKDSTVLAHIITSLRPDIQLWSYKDDLIWPGEEEHLLFLAQKYGWNLKIAKFSLWAEVEKIAAADGSLDDVITLFSKSWWAAVREQEKSYDGAFMGMRANESMKRGRNYKQRGDIYQTADWKWKCCPLATWDGEDVFAYLISNEIPILEIYTKTLFAPAEKIREGWFIPGSMRTSGEVVSLKYYHPEIYSKLSLLFPEVRSYA